MAVYDGFFDAVQNEETGEYDRAYGSEDFTQYFAQIIGSGVCIHDNPDSFKVRLEGGKAVVGPGYLFIQGYWCKNDADYTIDLPGTSNYAIVAHLNLGKRMIELEARSVAQVYPDSLVLAIVSPTSAEDTRRNTDICGVIDSAGELSSKVEWAVNYIDNEIEGKLAAAEADINAQAAKLDRKIAEVQAQVDRISPPPVGSIKFSASQDVGEEWLRCDGSFVNERDYPELVEALGKLIPSGDKFKLLSDGEIGPQISNGVVYGGRLWVYSYSTKKLYGVDLEGDESVKEIEVSSDDEHFGNFLQPTVQNPLALSIAPHSNKGGATLFLTQIIKSGGDKNGSGVDGAFLSYFLIFYAEFSGQEESLPLLPPFSFVEKGEDTPFGYYYPIFSANYCIPYVISKTENGVEKFYCAVGTMNRSGNTSQESPRVACLVWETGDRGAFPENVSPYLYMDDVFSKYQRFAFSKKTLGEIVVVSATKSGSDVYSYPVGTFSRELGASSIRSSRGSNLPLNIAGADKVISSLDKGRLPYADLIKGSIDLVENKLSLPSASRVFVDAAAYLWGKDIYMIFVGTGIIFSRTLEDGSFGYLDTTSVLGTITQFGYLDYSQDEGTLYLLGQDTSNRVKVAKIVLNTLYDYANDGAWLPMIAADGVPAYIKAKEAET